MNVANETVKFIEEAGGEAIFIKTNVIASEEVKELVNKTVEHFGDLHHAFNNAGVLSKPNKFADIPEEDFDKVIGVDVKGVYLSMKYELNHMLKNGGGTIVNTASVAGLIADPNMGPYVTAKHAVVGMTKAAGFDHAADNVRINAVAPGLTETPMTQVWKDDPEKWAEVTGNVPMRRAAKPEEIAEMVLFLSSEASSFVMLKYLQLMVDKLHIDSRMNMSLFPCSAWELIFFADEIRTPLLFYP